MARKTDAVRPGDHARVSFEGTIIHAFSGGMTIEIAGGDGVAIGFSGKDVAADTFTIEKIAKPIAVDDLVEWGLFTGEGGDKMVGRVMAMVGDFAMVGDHRGSNAVVAARPVVVDLRLLRHSQCPTS